MSKVLLWSCAAASVTGFGGDAVQRRELGNDCGVSKVLCDDGSCAWTAATCGGGAGSSTSYYSYSKWTPTSACSDNWASCSTTWQAETGGHQTQYTSYSAYYDSNYYSWDKNYANQDYSKFVDSEACVNDWSECVDATADYAGWQSQYADMDKYGNWESYAATADYGKYTENYEHYAAAKYDTYGDEGWGSYVTDYPTGANWDDYVDGANNKEYGSWRNYAKAAGKYDDYDSYYFAGVYVPGRYSALGDGGWSTYVSEYPGNDYAGSWSDYVGAANNKEYGDWRSYAKGAGKYDSYEQYYLPGVYVPKAYAEYGPTEAGWSKYVKDFDSESNDWVGTSYPDGTNWVDYANAANDKSASGEWRSLAKSAAKYDTYADYCAESDFC